MIFKTHKHDDVGDCSWLRVYMGLLSLLLPGAVALEKRNFWVGLTMRPRWLS